MAARYKSRAIAQYAPERIPELCAAVAGRSAKVSAQGAWSDWVTDLPGRLPQLTPASMLMPLVAQLPPPDMRLPKPIRRLDPAAVRHFHLQAVAGAPPPATAIDGGPLPAQAVASQEAASSSLSKEAISQLALSLAEARPWVSCTSRRLHKPYHATHPPTHPHTLGTPGEPPYRPAPACRPGRARTTLAVSPAEL